MTLLSSAGFLLLHDLLPTAIAYIHPDGRGVDLHPVTPTPDGGSDQDLTHAGLGEDTQPFHYGPAVRGFIAGMAVWCVDGATQLRAHSGYAPTDKDRADVALLAAHLELDPPEQYRSRSLSGAQAAGQGGAAGPPLRASSATGTTSLTHQIEARTSGDDQAVREPAGLTRRCRSKDPSLTIRVRRRWPFRLLPPTSSRSATGTSRRASCDECSAMIVRKSEVGW